MSWEQLLSIRIAAREDARALADTQPVACPFGGFPLEAGPNGTLHCPEGDYTWPE